jgi:hypothetical protein
MTASPLEVVAGTLTAHRLGGVTREADGRCRAVCTCGWDDPRTWNDGGQTLAEHRSHQSREVVAALHTEGLIQ